MTTEEHELLIPANMARVARQLREAMDLFVTLGIRIDPASRFPAMEKLLLRVADTGVYPSDPTELARITESIRDSQEIVNVADVIENSLRAGGEGDLLRELAPAFRRDLQKAVKGSLQPAGTVLGPPHQNQTQLWVGVMLAASGALAGFPEENEEEQRPDWVVTNGTLRYAVEVKRPNGQLDANTIVRKAARQVRGKWYAGGLVVVDLTDCIPEKLRCSFGHGAPDWSAVDEYARELLTQLHTKIYDDGREMLVPGREKTFGITVFLRAAYWDLDRLHEPPHLHRPVSGALYWRNDPNTLRAHRARWLSELLRSGMEEVGFLPTGPDGPLELTAELRKRALSLSRGG